MQSVKTKAPLRISFAGGGTDIEPYLSDYGAYVLSAAINLYIRAIYPAESNGSVLEEVLSNLTIWGKVRIIGDVEPELGLGGSASAYVAGVKAIYPQLDQEQVAKLAFYLERKVQGIKGGIQDQICASFGGFLFITLENGVIRLEKLPIDKDFNRFLLLVKVGDRGHSGNEVIEDQLRCYDVKVLHRQKQLARLMRDCLVKEQYLDFGKLLDETWQLKKKQSCLVTTPSIDEQYAKFLSMGAVSGVICGAGAGGSMLLMEHPEREGELRENLVKAGVAYRNVEFDTLGARVIEPVA